MPVAWPPALKYMRQSCHAHRRRDDASLSDIGGSMKESALLGRPCVTWAGASP